VITLSTCYPCTCTHLWMHMFARGCRRRFQVQGPSAYQIVWLILNARKSILGLREAQHNMKTHIKQHLGHSEPSKLVASCYVAESHCAGETQEQHHKTLTFAPVNYDVSHGFNQLVHACTRTWWCVCRDQWEWSPCTRVQKMYNFGKSKPRVSACNDYSINCCWLAEIHRHGYQI
jgi:hypothetical protein